MKKLLAILLALVMCLTLVPITIIASPDTSVKLAGDANGDGQINGADLVRIRKYLAGIDVEIDLACSDVNGDGKVNGGDLVRLRKYMAGLDVELIPPKDSSELTVALSVSQTEAVVSENQTVIFYAEVSETVDSVKLVDNLTGNVLLELVDDGMYSSSGDDLPGDNIYSARAELDTTKEIEYTYYAEAKDIKSNVVSIKVVSGLSEEDIQKIDSVDETLQNDLFKDENYSLLSIDQREDKTDALLKELINEDLIIENSVSYNENTSTYTFLYASSIVGLIMIGDEEPRQNSVSLTEAEPLNDSIDAEEREENDDDFKEPVFNDGKTINESVPLGKALILWSFAQSWDDENFRVPFYEEVEEEWDSRGLDTTIIFDTTVEDYKNLKGNDVIVFSGHGSYATYKPNIFSFNKTTVSSLLLCEKTTIKKDKNYSADLKSFRVGRTNGLFGTTYAILPNFFTYYYAKGDLDGSFVFAENCEFYGKNGKEDYTMANALRSASVESVIGFHNAVMANYSRNLMKSYVEGLMAGLTTKQAFDAAKKEHGENDYFTGREKHGPTAYPILVGEESSNLVYSNIKNGDFELSNTPVGWTRIGDTRVVSKLGQLYPPSKQRMGILTTGVGSAEEEYLAGTEGSVLSQTIKIPKSKSSIVFTYDYISEEPMEYVGSQFNDTFAVQIISSKGTQTVVINDINNSEWLEIDDIDFDGGDNTVYHIGWTNMEIDLSEYSGEIVDIRFIVYDVGDSIYDSAVLLDAVNLK